MADQIEWLFFDLDGTLNDNVTAFDRAIQVVLRHRYAAPGAELKDFSVRWSSALSERWGRYVREGLGSGAWFEPVVANFFPHHTTVVLSRIATEFWDEYVRHVTVFADVPTMLFGLGGRYRIGLLTNGHGVLERQVMERLGLGELFGAVFISGERGVHKPDSRFFSEALELSGATPAKSLYLGSRVDGDVQVAHRLGLNAVWLNRRSNQRSLLVPTIHTLGELRALLPAVSAPRAEDAPSP